jgi:hypothetical protein
LLSFGQSVIVNIKKVIERWTPWTRTGRNWKGYEMFRLTENEIKIVGEK